MTINNLYMNHVIVLLFIDFIHDFRRYFQVAQFILAMIN